jgi:glutaminase
MEDPGASSFTPVVSTGELPDPEIVSQLLNEAHRRYRSVDTGKVADYIPALAKAPKEWFGLSVVGVKGGKVSVGDADVLFSIQSISKAFVFALVCEELGQDVVRQKIGVNNTGLPFNSVMAIELNAERTMNPMVNAGAIATTSLVPGATEDEKWQFILGGLSRFAGRTLEVDNEVYASESQTNQHNRGIATLVAAYGRLYSEPAQTVDLYTRQCSIGISVGDLAAMGSTLANGGVNPITGEHVIGAELCKRVLAVLATTGLYERSGEWLYEIGLPGKSGVSGGIVTVSPGKGSLATFSPPLDAAGNSVRGQLATEFLSEYLGLNIFASTPR